MPTRDEIDEHSFPGVGPENTSDGSSASDRLCDAIPFYAVIERLGDDS